MRALIIDDEPAICHMLTAVLKRSGWEVSTAATGEDALEVLTWEQFDALLIDKNLPGIDGVEVVRRVRESDQRTVCIMITGYANTESAKETLNLGVDAYIQKPVDNVLALVDRIGELIAVRRGRRDTAPTAQVRVNALIVSASPDLCTKVAQYLQPYDLPVVEPVAPDANTAQTIVTRAPGLVVFESSAATLKIIQALNARPPTPTYVVITDPAAPLAHVVGYIDLGVKALVEKPIDQRQFEAAMANVIGDVRSDG
jgi:DNA-binding response OmpR family regulator